MTDAQEDLAQRWYERKSAMMAEMLGREHDMVMHALIPYAVGGALDLYYYHPTEFPGTAIATKELSEAPDEGSTNRVYSCYELVMFTRHPLNLELARDTDTPFGRMHQAISAILNPIARYSAEATLNPNETCEFPADTPGVGGRCLMLDGFDSRSGEMTANFGLMAIIEVFRSEMEYARKRGGEKLLTRLKRKGHYPYSDLDRSPVA